MALEEALKSAKSRRRVRNSKLAKQDSDNSAGILGYRPGLTVVNRQSKLPLHQQIYEILRGNMLRGKWAAGEMFPTELELMEEYQVSRATIRQVMDRLVSEGLIHRQRGRGTFISEPTLEQGLSRIISFTEDMRRRGLVSETRILEAEVIPAVEDIASVLKIQTGESVAYLKRLRIANNEPMCIEESHLSYKLCPGIFDYDFSVQPLRETLEKKYNIHITRALQKIHASVAGQETARLLGVNSPAALLFIERTSFNEYDVPVEFLRLYFRGDRYSLYNELRD
jgi:GntR family transcriptional regulator